MCGNGAVVCVQLCRELAAPQSWRVVCGTQSMGTSPGGSAALLLHHPALGELPATILCALLFSCVKGKSKILLISSHFFQGGTNQYFNAYGMND